MGRLGKLAVRTAFCFSLAPTSAGAQTPLEQQVLAVLNLARTNPQAYAEQIKTFRTYFKSANYHLPGTNEEVATEEGTAVVDETIAFLSRQRPLPPIATADLLARSAATLVADQSATGSTGHAGSDGSSPGDRAERVGGGDFVAEVIAYGPVDAVDAIRQLIVDDGVADRGHRTVIFSPELAFAGVSCGTHKEFRTMCVVDLGVTPDGREPGERKLASADPPRSSKGH